MDFTQVVEAQLPSADIERFARLTLFSAKSKRAIVVRHSPLFFGLARMYGQMLEYSGADAEGIEIFEDLASAKGWLGLEDAPLRTDSA